MTAVAQTPSSLTLYLHSHSKDDGTGEVTIVRPQPDGTPTKIAGIPVQDSKDEYGFGSDEIQPGQSVSLKTDLADLKVKFNEIGLADMGMPWEGWEEEVALDIDVTGTQQLDPESMARDFFAIRSGKVQRNEHLIAWNDEARKHIADIEITWTESDGVEGRLVFSHNGSFPSREERRKEKG